MRPVENRIPAMGTRGRTMFSARGQSPRMTWSSRLGIEGREGEPERLKIPRKIRTRAIAAATLPLVMAAVITAAWLVMVQPAWAQAPDDVNDDGRPYVWVQDWKLPGSVPHDVTEGDDMTFTVIRDGTDLSGPATMTLRWEKRPNSPEIRNMIEFSFTDNPRPDSITIPAGQTQTTASWSTHDDAWERDIWLFACIHSRPTAYQFHEDRFGADRNCTGWRIRDDDPAPTSTPTLKSGQEFEVTEGESVNLQLTRSLPAGKTSPPWTGI